MGLKVTIFKYPLMRKILLFLLFATVSIGVSHSQILDPVKWTTSIKKISDTEYDLISKAKIDKGWHLYSQVVPEDGPLPTNFVFEENDAYKSIGEVRSEERRVGKECRCRWVSY